jgi:hypothetical protein
VLAHVQYDRNPSRSGWVFCFNHGIAFAFRREPAMTLGKKASARRRFFAIQESQARWFGFNQPLEKALAIAP